jgi:hypothetical protein
MHRTILVGFVLVTLALGAPGAGAVDPAGIERSALEARGTGFVESVDMLFHVRPGGVLSMGTSTGSVTVQTWARDQIRLVVTKRVEAPDADAARRILDLFSIRALHGGKDLKLKALARTRECADQVGVEFAIWVPRSYNLAITTSNGSISLPEMDGAFSARTGDGTISVDCSTDDLDVEVEDRTERDAPPERPGRGGGDHGVRRIGE